VGIDGISIDKGSLSTILSNLKTYNAKTTAALLVITDLVAKSMEQYAKSNAKWEDRTSNARQGIKGQAYWESISVLVCSLSHTMEYGVWLELANEKKYAILEETIEKYKPEMIARWKTVVGD